MHEFAEEYVANLKPRDERYDTRLGDDFYVATFPNGVKTWSFVFEVNGYTRRQTLGIYPEMPLQQALEALYAARRTRAVESELTEQGLNDGQVRKTEDSPVNLTARLRVPQIRLPGTKRPFFAGVMTSSVFFFSAAVAVWVFFSPRLNVNQDEPVATVAPPTSVVLSEPGLVSAAETQKPQPDDGQIPGIQPVQPTVPSSAAPAAATRLSQADAVTMPADAADRVASRAAIPASEPAVMSESQIALRRLQEDMAGTLAWAQLTSAIRDGEPVDQLDWVVEVSHAPRRVFYFVRVRGMAGANVTYRWRHEGKLLKEDIVEVGKGWHSPAYSGMTLTADRLGHWQVQVYDPNGSTLGTEEFETRLPRDMPRVSQR